MGNIIIICKFLTSVYTQIYNFYFSNFFFLMGNFYISYHKKYKWKTKMCVSFLSDRFPSSHVSFKNTLRGNVLFGFVKEYWCRLFKKWCLFSHLWHSREKQQYCFEHPIYMCILFGCFVLFKLDLRPPLEEWGSWKWGGGWKDWVEGGWLYVGS